MSVLVRAQARIDEVFVRGNNHFYGQIDGNAPCFFCLLQKHRNFGLICCHGSLDTRCVTCEDSAQKCGANFLSRQRVRDLGIPGSKYTPPTARGRWRMVRAIKAAVSAWRSLQALVEDPSRSSRSSNTATAVFGLQETASLRELKVLEIQLVCGIISSNDHDDISARIEAAQPLYQRDDSVIKTLLNTLEALDVAEDTKFIGVHEGDLESFSVNMSTKLLDALETYKTNPAPRCPVTYAGIPPVRRGAVVDDKATASVAIPRLPVTAPQTSQVRPSSTRKAPPRRGRKVVEVVDDDDDGDGDYDELGEGGVPLYGDAAAQPKSKAEVMLSPPSTWGCVRRRGRTRLPPPPLGPPLHISLRPISATEPFTTSSFKVKSSPATQPADGSGKRRKIRASSISYIDEDSGAPSRRLRPLP
ncbi:hypothetical protein G7Z17_g4150 [Cylindrodendrum hubeiense]|uniref:Uncharacterized protein n=1 Tax=Cylindrodendrum hubeiense TaxID=595255 RepID=A0A9P5HJM4_9HYPO|nr:hypothetical protein G7Z17_g4150 [Cylindrodendrum hubeiense]